MENQLIFLENAYREAMNYADKAINKAKKIKDAYCENDVLYRRSLAKNSFIVLLCIALGVGGFFFEKQLYDLLGKIILSSVNLGSLELLISIFYICFCFTGLGHYLESSIQKDCMENCKTLIVLLFLLKKIRKLPRGSYKV